MIVRKLSEIAQQHPGASAYSVRTSSGGWRATSWKTYHEEVREVGKTLISLDIRAGDRIAIWSPNCPEWATLALGAMSVGVISTGIYTTSSPEEASHILHHAEVSLLMVDTPDRWDLLRDAIADLTSLKTVICLGDDIPETVHNGHSWSSFIRLGREIPEVAFDARADAVAPDDVATLIYTSGTTGKPKGVMLTHSNVLQTAHAAKTEGAIDHSDRLLSYLPLSHIAEQLVSVYIPLATGAHVHYAESLESVPRDLREVAPTIFLGVPRVWEKIRATIMTELEQLPRSTRWVVHWAQRIATQVLDRRHRGQAIPWTLRLRLRLAERMVFTKLHNRLGFTSLRFGLTGAAPIAREVLAFFQSLNISIYELYGQSEGTGSATSNRPGHARLGTVGLPTPGIDVRLAEDGEILVRGFNVFKGYFKDAEATEAVLKDGWLYSGDLGKISEEGYIHIIGRKKDIVITSGGKNVAPAAIENALTSIPFISQAVLVGDARPFLCALLTVDPTHLVAMGGVSNADSPHNTAVVRTAVQRLLDEDINPRFARAEQVKKFAILPRPLDIEHGELTPSMKIKRHVVLQRYRELIDTLYT